MLWLPLLLMLQSPPAPDAESYQSLLGCAAFHGIEGERLTRANDAAGGEAQRALGEDFKTAATQFLPSEKAAQVDADLAALTAAYRERLGSGEARSMAEQWTALELACRELYPMLAGLQREAARGER